MQVAAIKSNVAVTMGMIGGFDAQIMLDSGSSVSLIRKEILHKAQGIDRIQSDDPPMQLVTASGDELPVLEYVVLEVCAQVCCCGESCEPRHIRG